MLPGLSETERPAVSQPADQLKWIKHGLVVVPKIYIDFSLWKPKMTIGKLFHLFGIHVDQRICNIANSKINLKTLDKKSCPILHRRIL